MFRYLSTGLAFLTFLFFFQFSLAQTFVQKQKLVEAQRDTVGMFGTCIVLSSEDTLLIGCPNFDFDVNGNYVNDLGAIYVFVKDSSDQWVEDHKIHPHVNALRFGQSFVLRNSWLVVTNVTDSISFYRKSGSTWLYSHSAEQQWPATIPVNAGEYIVAGIPSYHWDTDTGVGGVAVYAIDSQGKWQLNQIVVDSNKLGSYGFGNRIAYSNGYLVVGCSQDEPDSLPNNFESGSAVIFKLDSSGNINLHQKIFAPYPEALRKFPTDIFIEGPHLFMSSIEQNVDDIQHAGSVYYYKLSSNQNWSLEQIISASNPQFNSAFGTRLDYSNGLLLITSFKNNYDHEDQNFISQAGAAYVFTSNLNGEWLQIDKIVVNDRRPSQYFGLYTTFLGHDLVISATRDDHSFQDSNGQTVFLESAGAVYYFSLENVGSMEAHKEQSAVILYPNPSQGEVHLESTEDLIKIQFYDALGSYLTGIDVIESGETLFFLPPNPGFYIVEIIYSDGRIARFKVLRL
jgi:hypothetical protein